AGNDPPVPDRVRAWVNALLADPYGWIDRSTARLSIQRSDDDTAFVLLDGQPAIPVLGLMMRRSAGSWKFVLPTGVPPIAGYAPRSRQQWSIVGSLIRIIDRGVTELTADVDSGAVASLEDLASRAQDKMMMPGMIAFAAYGRELDVGRRIE